MGCLAAADDDMPRGRPFVDVELREHFPAASSSQDTYTLLKFYNLSKDLVKTVLRVSLLHNILHICTLLHTVLLLLPNQHIIRSKNSKSSVLSKNSKRSKNSKLHSVLSMCADVESYSFWCSGLPCFAVLCSWHNQLSWLISCACWQDTHFASEPNRPMSVNLLWASQAALVDGCQCVHA